MQSCTGPVYPMGMRTGPFGPRIVQPPVPYHRDVNELPSDPNFVQTYTQHKKTKTNSNFGALIRIIEFEYDISDTIKIHPRITTGYDEGEMTGTFTIMLDQYELTYKNDEIQVREYVEELSYDPSEMRTNTRVIYDPIGAAATKATQKEENRNLKRSQLYNSSYFFLEPEDARMLLRSKTLYYIVQLQNCEIAIFPSKEQIKVIKRMIQTYFV